MENKRCALCEVKILIDSPISLCNECLKCADCCIGLEKIEKL